MQRDTMPTTNIFSSLLDCFSCCGQQQDSKHDQYLQPLNLLQPQVPSVTGAARAAAVGRPNAPTQLRGCRAGSTFVPGGCSSLQGILPCCSRPTACPSALAVEELVEQSSTARERVWRSLGSLEPFALGQSPASTSVMAGPKWPAVRQNFRVIHRPSGNVMIVSDGLSDPFDDIHEGGWGPGRAGSLCWLGVRQQRQLAHLPQPQAAKIAFGAAAAALCGAQARTTSTALAWSSSLRRLPRRLAAR